jgi:hypothetical protein
MKESLTYQALVEEGRREGRREGLMEGAIAEAKKILRFQGDKMFGPPGARTIAVIERLNNLAQLEDILMCVRSARSWQELVGKAGTSQRSSRRRPNP